MKEQLILDNEHLRLLSIFHYVSAAMVALWACLPLIHLAMGVFLIVAGSDAGQGHRPPPAAGWAIVAMSGTLICLGWSVAAGLALVGRNLARKKHYTFCFIVAALSILGIPFGTLLGGCTILVLIRPTVKQVFS